MSVVAEGRYGLLYIDLDEDGNWLPILCAEDMTFDVEAEMIPMTGPASGNSRDWYRRLSTYRSTVTGLTPISNGTEITWFYILQLGESGTKRLFKQTFVDSLGNTRSYSGYALIGSQSINAPQSDFSHGNIEIWWKGKPEADNIPPPATGDIFWEYIDCVAGETSVHLDDLEAAGITIIKCSRTGMQYNETTGTPGNMEFKYGGVDGYLYFDAGNPFNSGEWIYVEWRT